eukprot:TRINITY_DN1757_c0_g4_i1.p1 TRINITY_DN1757_c0_g4~~TRINITY_DN1757_c0_g4_i1.p1  ORF type:complete len:2273 (+),score=521.29 TRINITY_DN1757_c0_g4_i1:136-6954(+)
MHSKGVTGPCEMAERQLRKELSQRCEGSNELYKAVENVCKGADEGLLRSGLRLLDDLAEKDECWRVVFSRCLAKKFAYLLKSVGCGTPTDFNSLFERYLSQALPTLPASPYLAPYLVELRRDHPSLTHDVKQAIKRIPRDASRLPTLSFDYSHLTIDTYPAGRKKGQWVTLGRGAICTVISATFLRKPVAIKEWQVPDTTKQAVVAKLHGEVLALEHLCHINLAAVYGVVHDANGEPPQGLTADVGILTDRVQMTLGDLLFEEDPMPLDKLLAICVEAAAGTVYLHQCSIHANIKPSNVGLTMTGSVKLLDYGPWRNPDHDWAAPEVVRGQALLLSDVYSWAAICLSGISQQRPRKGQSGVIPERSSSGDVVSSGMSALLSECLSETPTLRPNMADCYKRATMSHGDNEGHRPHQMQPEDTQQQLEAVPLPEERYIPMTSLRSQDTWEVIGEGSFGQVYKTVFEPMQDVVAVKELLIDPDTETQKKLQRKLHFHKEIVNLHTLRVNQVLNFYGWTADSTGRLFMVTEYCARGHLKGVLDSERRSAEMTPKDWGHMSLDVGLTIAQSLTLIHSKDWVHLDVAARNVLVTAWGQYKLSDVGLLTKVNGPAPVIAIPWSPPEALRAKAYERVATVYHDMWSFGVLLYEVLNKGPAPFEELRITCTSDQDWLDSLVKSVVSGVKPLPPVTVAQDPLCKAIWDTVIVPCRSMAPSKRPTMKEVIQTIVDLRGSSCASEVSSPVTSGGPTVCTTEMNIYGGDAVVYGGDTAPEREATGSSRDHTEGSEIGDTLTRVLISRPRPCPRRKFTDCFEMSKRLYSEFPCEWATLIQQWTEQEMWSAAYQMTNWESVGGKIWPSPVLHAALKNAELIAKRHCAGTPLSTFLPVYMYTAELYLPAVWCWYDADVKLWKRLDEVDELEAAALTLRSQSGGHAEVTIPKCLGRLKRSQTEQIWLLAPSASYEQLCGITRYDIGMIPVMRYENAQRGNPVLSPLYDSAMWCMQPGSQSFCPPPGILEYIYSRSPDQTLQGNTLVRVNGKDGVLVDGKVLVDGVAVPSCQAQNATETFPEGGGSWKVVPCETEAIAGVKEQLRELALQRSAVNDEVNKKILEALNGSRNLKAIAAIKLGTGSMEEILDYYPPADEVLKSLEVQYLTVDCGGMSEKYLLSLSGHPMLVAVVSNMQQVQLVDCVSRFVASSKEQIYDFENKACIRDHEKLSLDGTASATITPGPTEDDISGKYLHLPGVPTRFCCDDTGYMLSKESGKWVATKDGDEISVEASRIDHEWCVSPVYYINLCVKALLHAIDQIPFCTPAAAYYRCIPETFLKQYEDNTVLVYPGLASFSSVREPQSVTSEHSLFGISCKGTTFKDLSPLSRFQRDEEVIAPPGTTFKLVRSQPTIDLKIVPPREASKMIVRSRLMDLPTGCSWAERVVFKTLHALDGEGRLDLSLKTVNDGMTPDRWQFWIAAPPSVDTEPDCPITPSFQWNEVGHELTSIVDAWWAVATEGEAPLEETSDLTEDITRVLGQEETEFATYFTFMTEMMVTPKQEDTFVLEITGLDFGADGGALRVTFRKRKGRGCLAIGVSGAKFLAELISLNIPLSRISLQYNALGMDGAEALLHGLRTNKHVVEVSLMSADEEGIPEDVLEALRLRTLLNWAPAQLTDYLWDAKPSIVGKALWDVHLWECDLSKIAEREPGHARELVSRWYEARTDERTKDWALVVPHDCHGGSYLHLAAAADWCRMPWRDMTLPLKAIETLARHTYKINQRDSKGMSALHYAAMNLSDITAQIITSLMSKGADPWCKDNVLDTPMHKAARSGTPEALQQIIESAPESETTESINALNRFGHTILMAAAMNTRFNTASGTQIIQQLVSKGCTLDARDRDRRTALHHAASFGCRKIVIELATLGADVDTMDSSMQSVIMLVASNKRFNTTEGVKVVKALVAGGVSVCNRVNGELPVVVASANHQSEIIPELIPSDLSLLTDDELTVLLNSAARYGHPCVVKAVLAQTGMQEVIWRLDGRRASILHKCAKNSNYDTAEGLQLLEMLNCPQLDVNEGNESGRTPLWYAANAGHCTLSEYFLKMGSNVSLKDKIGNNPVHEATNYVNCLQTILNSEHVNKQQLVTAIKENSKRNYTPLKLAICNDMCWCDTGRACIETMLTLAELRDGDGALTTAFLQRLQEKKLRDSLPLDDAKLTLQMLKAHNMPPIDNESFIRYYDVGLDEMLKDWSKNGIQYFRQDSLKMDLQRDHTCTTCTNDSLQRHWTPWDEDIVAD